MNFNQIVNELKEEIPFDRLTLWIFNKDNNKPKLKAIYTDGEKQNLSIDASLLDSFYREVVAAIFHNEIFVINNLENQKIFLSTLYGNDYTINNKMTIPYVMRIWDMTSLKEQNL